MTGFIQGPGHLLQLMREQRKGSFRSWAQQKWHSVAHRAIRNTRRQIVRLALWRVPVSAWAVPLDLMPLRFQVLLAVVAFEVEDPEESQLTALQKTLLEFTPMQMDDVQRSLAFRCERREQKLQQFMELFRHMQAAEEILDQEESA